MSGAYNLSRPGAARYAPRDAQYFERLQLYASIHEAEVKAVKSTDTEDIHFTAESPSQLISRLKAQDGKDIWICGGADIANQLMKDGLIDVLHLTVLPVALGNGIRLFNDNRPLSRYSLTKLNRYADIIEMIYAPDSK